jgi:hypothetical protein
MQERELSELQRLRKAPRQGEDDPERRREQRVVHGDVASGSAADVDPALERGTRRGEIAAGETDLADARIRGGETVGLPGGLGDRHGLVDARPRLPELAELGQ